MHDANEIMNKINVLAVPVAASEREGAWSPKTLTISRTHHIGFDLSFGAQTSRGTGNPVASMSGPAPDTPLAGPMTPLHTLDALALAERNLMWCRRLL